MRIRRPVLTTLALLVLLGGLAFAAGWWYVLGEERRSARIVGGLLVQQTGLPITIGRAVVGPHALVFRDVRVAPGPHWSGDVRIRELRLEGGSLRAVFPRGRPIEVVVVAASVTLGASREPVTAPTADVLETVRRQVIQAIEWSAPVSVRVEGGELRAGDQVFAFNLTGDKTVAGALGLTLDIAPPDSGPALTLRLAGQRDTDRVTLRLGLEAQPARLGAFWPAAWPAVARARLDADGVLVAGGRLDVTGRLSAQRLADASPMVADFAAAYDGAVQRLDLPHLTATWGSDRRLTGKGRADLKDGTRLVLDLTGSVDGTGVTAALGYGAARGTLSGDVTLERLDARRLYAMAGLGSPPTDLTARRLRATVGGTVEAERVRLDVRATLDEMQLPVLLAGTRVDGALTTNAILGRESSSLALAQLGRTTLRLERDGAPVLVASGQSRAGAAWPVAVEGTLDLRRMPSPPALPATVEGRATVTGDLDLRRGGPRFAGHLTADVPRAEIRINRPITATRIRLAVPISHGVPASSRPGTMTAERVEAFGFSLDRLESAAHYADGRLRLSDIRYRHYGGQGSGWIEAAVDRRTAVPLKARVEGEHIDLAALTREYGLTVARLSGKVRYLVVLQYSAARGFNGAGQVTSEENGGEIATDAIEKLLSSAVVQGEKTGLLRQLLENLRVFRYSTLDGEVRVTRDSGYVNLSIEGKKRLGIFPPPIRAINFNNVPIALLARLFGRKESS